ncbi:MAG: hypothetical protein EB127_07190 [Alphaproteobacteria bacterium]|nr:hypothetical protein [Alphaproteobacteria bacterium]
MMNYNAWFPIIIAYEDNINISIEPIIEYIHQLMKNDKGRILSNIGGWQSNNVDHQNPVFKDLFEIFRLKVNEYIDTMNWNIYAEIDNVWINVNYKNNSNRSHVHPNSILSGVFYINVPENSGSIFFENPSKTLFKTNLPFESKNRDDPILNSEIRYDSIQKRLLIFRHLRGRKKTREYWVFRVVGTLRYK